MQKKWLKWITATLGILFLLFSYPMLSYQGSFLMGYLCLFFSGLILCTHFFLPIFLRHIQSQNGDYSLLKLSSFRYLKRIFIAISLLGSIILFFLSPLVAERLIEHQEFILLFRLMCLFPVPLTMVGIYRNLFQLGYWKEQVTKGTILTIFLMLSFYFLLYLSIVLWGRQSVLVFFEVWILFCFLFILLEYGYLFLINKKQCELLSKVDWKSKKVSIRTIWNDNKVLLLFLFSIFLLFLGYRVVLPLYLPSVLHHKFYMSISRIEETLGCYLFYSFVLQLALIFLSFSFTHRFFQRETSSSLSETSKKVVRYWMSFLSKFLPVLVFLILISTELFGMIYGMEEPTGLLFGLDLTTTLLCSLVIVLEYFLFRFGSYRILIVGNILFFFGKWFFATSIMTSFYKMGVAPILGVLVSDIVLFLLLLVFFLLWFHHLTKSSCERTVEQVMGYLTSCTLAGALTLLCKKLLWMVLPDNRLLSFFMIGVLSFLFAFSYRLMMKFQKIDGSLSSMV